MSGNVLLTVGSVLRGDDAAGPLLAKLMTDSPVEGWSVVDGGQCPEDELGFIRRLEPDTVLVFDAADMGLEPGAVRRLTADDVATSCLVSTHTIPITFLLHEIEGMADHVVFLGVQPADTSFFGPLTPAVRESVEVLCSLISSGGDWENYRLVNGEDGA